MQKESSVASVSYKTKLDKREVPKFCCSTFQTTGNNKGKRLHCSLRCVNLQSAINYLSLSIYLLLRENLNKLCLKLSD